MKKNFSFLGRIFIFFLLSFSFIGWKQSRKNRGPASPKLVSVTFLDHNGFVETVSHAERLAQLQKINFLNSQPFQKIQRVYERDKEGRIYTVITTYYENGNIKQLLEGFNGRAQGDLKEWHENGAKSMVSKVVGGLLDLTSAAEKTFIFDGIIESFNQEEELLKQCAFRKGLRDGPSIYYHPQTKKVWRYLPYKNGLLEGSAKCWDNKGNLIVEESYKEGLKEGESKRYWIIDNQVYLASQEEYCQGKLVNGQYFDREGNLFSEVKNGFGYQAIFDVSYIKFALEYQDGRIKGEVKTYLPGGEIQGIYHLKNGEKHGEEIRYYPHKPGEPLQKQLSFFWNEGAIHGIRTTWYPNGTMASRTEFAHNRMNGLSTTWYENGDVMHLEKYVSDKLQEGRYFRLGEIEPCSQVSKYCGKALIFNKKGELIQDIEYINGRPNVKREGI